MSGPEESDARMRGQLDEDALVRRYLLGQLDESQQQAVETRLMTDGGFANLLEACEDDLIDDYLGGTLSTEDEEIFRRFFFVNPERRRKLSFAMEFRTYVRQIPLAASHAEQSVEEDSAPANQSVVASSASRATSYRW